MVVKSLEKIGKRISISENLGELIKDIKVIAFKEKPEIEKGSTESCAWSTCHCATYKKSADEPAGKLADSCAWSSCHCAAYKK